MWEPNDPSGCSECGAPDEEPFTTHSRTCVQGMVEARAAAGLPFGLSSGRSGPRWAGQIGCGICRSDRHDESFCPRLLTGQCQHGEAPAGCLRCFHRQAIGGGVS